MAKKPRLWPCESQSAAGLDGWELGRTGQAALLQTPASYEDEAQSGQVFWKTHFLKHISLGLLLWIGIIRLIL